MAKRRHEVNGKLIQCRRCNAMLFLKHLGKQDMDGGYTVFDQYEMIPNSWIYDSTFGYLCPSCGSTFEEKMSEFFFTKDHLPPAWKVKEDNIFSATDTMLYMSREVTE